MTMTREELKGRQTPGQCEVTDDGRIWGGLDFGDMIADVWIDEHANAALYAEAHNVANRTGMWPEDLVARVKELEEALDTITQQTERAGWDGMSVHHARAILNKSTP